MKKNIITHIPGTQNEGLDMLSCFSKEGGEVNETELDKKKIIGVPLIKKWGKYEEGQAPEIGNYYT